MRWAPITSVLFLGSGRRRSASIYVCIALASGEERRRTQKESQTEKVTKLNLIGTMVVWADTENSKVQGTKLPADGVIAKKEAQLKRLRKINATVIPAPRKSVKRMMFETVLEFMVRVFSSEENPTNQDDADIKLNPKVRPPCSTSIRRIHPQG